MSNETEYNNSVNHSDIDHSKLIGMRVRNTGSNEIGVISAIRDGLVIIDYHGEMRKHAFPAAFASFLVFVA